MKLVNKTNNAIKEMVLRSGKDAETKSMGSDVPGAGFWNKDKKRDVA